MNSVARGIVPCNVRMKRKKQLRFERTRTRLKRTGIAWIPWDGSQGGLYEVSETRERAGGYRVSRVRVLHQVCRRLRLLEPVGHAAEGCWRRRHPYQVFFLNKAERQSNGQRGQRSVASFLPASFCMRAFSRACGRED